MPDVLWSPPPDAWATTRIGKFASRHRPDATGDYEQLWTWSVSEPSQFWGAIWEHFDTVSHSPHEQVLSDDPMPTTKWFEGATLNYAEHMLRGNGLADDDVAVIAESQTRDRRTLTLGELREQVRRAAAGLRRLGVGPGDRVAALLPNVEETLVASLATASLGAIWSSCAPEFGVRAVLDRWSQIEPTVLLVTNGYRYGKRDVELGDAVASIRDGLASVKATVALHYLDTAASTPDAIGWDDLIAPCDDELTFTPVPFDHPLYILYSSGTTGLPKAIVHGHGGVLLEHTKQLALQMDLGPGDRFFWFSTTGWMMWNFVISGLLVGSSIVLFDGNPGHPDLDMLWSLVADTEATYAGMSAPFLMACRSAGLTPGADHNLSALRGVGSTGAPLPADGFRWVAAHVADVPLSSISGGTDVCTAFLGGAPVLPVTAGVIPCRQLGWNIQAFDEDRNALRDAEGELVIVSPAPSMPVSFWGDEDDSRYRSTYFSPWPEVWRHGDWLTIAADGTCIVSGRSDATLNRGGVRLGTADFYTVAEADPAIDDSLVVHLEDDEGGLGELLLFVTVADGAELDDTVRTRVATALRAELSPRHGPDSIIEVPIVPRTLSGKKLEIPVKRILLGADPAKVASRGSLSDPTSLDPYIDIANSR